MRFNLWPVADITALFCQRIFYRATITKKEILYLGIDRLAIIIQLKRYGKEKNINYDKIGTVQLFVLTQNAAVHRDLRFGHGGVR